MQPFGCMRASKDGGCSLLLDPMWRLPRPSPTDLGFTRDRNLLRKSARAGLRWLARPKRPGEHLRVTAKVSRLGRKTL